MIAAGTAGTILTYGWTCVAVLVAGRRGSTPDAPAGYFSLGRWLVPVTATCVLFSLAVIVFMVGPPASPARPPACC